jgi:hypothetical protein
MDICCQTGNFNQDRIFFHILQKTNSREGPSSMLTDTKGKEHLLHTVMIANTTSSRKPPLYTIFKQKLLPEEKMPCRIHVMIQEK